MTIDSQNNENLQHPKQARVSFAHRVNNPSHYNQPPVQESQAALFALGYAEEDFDKECIEAIKKRHQAGRLFWHSRLNAEEYLWRAGNKGGPAQAQEDWAKSRWCLQYCLALIESWGFCWATNEEIEEIKTALELIP